MTITPEKLRRKADEMKAASGALYLSGQSMASMQVKDWSEVLRQAADEIERLRKEVERLKPATYGWGIRP